MILIPALSALGFLIIIIKAIGIKKVIEYEIHIDVLFTIGFLIFSGGTYSGIKTAVIAGVILSLTLAIIKLIYKPFTK